jgi:trigger factor
MPPARPVTATDLLIRLAEPRRQHGARRMRAKGDRVELGDDVQVRMLGYAGGRPVPGSLRYDEWIELAPEEALPGFAEKLVGTPVGSVVEIPTTLKGRPVKYLVDVRGACAVMPLADDSPALLAALGAKSLDEVMASLAEDLEEERVQAAAREVRERAIDELAVRVKVQVPADLLREEIRRRWMDREGRKLAWLSLDAAKMQGALDAWLEDEGIVREVDRSIRAYLALSAIAREERVQPDFGRWMDDLVALTKESRESIRTALARDKALAARLAETATQAAALDLVMKHATITGV